MAHVGVLGIGWTPSPDNAEPLEVAAALTQRRYPGGVLVMHLLQSESPRDPGVLCNLGMALGDADELPAAIETEQQATAKGNVRFFELIPQEVHSKVTTRLDFSDDWSVDGDSQNDTS